MTGDTMQRNSMVGPTARIVLLALTLTVVVPAIPKAASQPPPTGQSEFVPVDELGPVEQLPAAPLLITAYAIIWIALLGYLWSIRRRMGAIEKELADVARKVESVERRA